MNTVFADAFYYFALLSPSDEAHRRALEFTAGFNGRLFTTAWVLTELADGLAAPEHRQAFTKFHNELRSDPQVVIVPPDADLFDEGLALYADRPDKEWSLSDCISFIIMEREGIAEALTGDHHFEQAGFVALLK